MATPAHLQSAWLVAASRAEARMVLQSWMASLVESIGRPPAWPRRAAPRQGQSVPGEGSRVAALVRLLRLLLLPLLLRASLREGWRCGRRGSQGCRRLLVVEAQHPPGQVPS